MLTMNHVCVSFHQLRVVTVGQAFPEVHFLPLMLVRWQSRHILCLSCSVLEHLEIFSVHRPYYNIINNHETNRNFGFHQIKRSVKSFLSFYRINTFHTRSKLWTGILWFCQAYLCTTDGSLARTLQFFRPVRNIFVIRLGVKINLLKLIDEIEFRLQIKHF